MARTFTETLRDLRSGEADLDASAALSELIAAVRETGRAGSLVIELKLKPVNKDGHQLMVEDVIKVKKPMPQRGTTVLFTTNENVLQRKDPRQPELANLREVSPGGNVTGFKKNEAAEA